MRVTPPRFTGYVIEINGRESWLIQEALRGHAEAVTDPALRGLAIELADTLRENA